MLEIEGFVKSLNPTMARGVLTRDQEGERKILHSSQYSSIKKLCWMDENGKFQRNFKLTERFEQKASYA
jgi:hypothetical protein